MREIIIFITVLANGDGSMCEDPVMAQNIADEFNGPDSHCVKGDEPGQWLIEEPTLVDENGIGRTFNKDEEITIAVEDAYCFYGNEMPIRMFKNLPVAVAGKISADYAAYIGD